MDKNDISIEEKIFEHFEEKAIDSDFKFNKDDFYNRIVVNDNIEEKEIKKFVQGCDENIKKLTQILRKKYKNEVGPRKMQALIKKIKKEQGKISDILKNYLDAAEDLHKLNNLREVLTIPDERGEKKYCILAESAGGVTEKVSLVSLEKVKRQLKNFKSAKFVTIEDYSNGRDYYKLRTEAILKLPKHNIIKEVQRESIALNLSRFLELNTTHSSIMTYKGTPVLYVPFDNIRLLKDFCSGEVRHKYLMSTGKYLNKSTINPVGMGLQGNHYIEDFGKAFGLFYICSDPDSFGGYNQNKALINNKSLYIFDQVVMSKDYLKLDSRISTQPCTSFSRHTRHGQGRNRTLVEDSSFESKLKSLEDLMLKKTQIENYIKRITKTYENKIQALKERKNNRSNDFTSSEKLLLKQLEYLQKDAQLISDVITRRINSVNEVLLVSSREKNVDNHTVMQVLVLEKLLHNPRLFTKQGRPYRHPWTYRHQKSCVKNINFDKNDEFIFLKFDKKVPKEMVAFLKDRRGIKSISIPPNEANVITINKRDLKKLDEGLLHPEYQTRLQKDTNYLDINELKMISNAYGKGHNTKMINLMSEYINKVDLSPTKNGAQRTHLQEQRKIINKTFNVIYLYLLTAEDKGFGQHLIKKIHFDLQQRLQKLITEKTLLHKVNQAFTSAVKLDQVSMFNKVLFNAILNGNLNKPGFQKFLETCIDLESNVKNHVQAVEASKIIYYLGAKLTERPVTEIIDVSEKDLDNVNEEAVNLLEDQLKEEHELLSNEPIERPTNDTEIEIENEESQVKSFINVKNS